MNLCSTLPTNLFLRDRGDGKPTILACRCRRRMLTPHRGADDYFARFSVSREVCSADAEPGCEETGIEVIEGREWCDGWAYFAFDTVDDLEAWVAESPEWREISANYSMTRNPESWGEIPAVCRA